MNACCVDFSGSSGRDDDDQSLAAVRADDALLDMLGGTIVITDDELSRVLYAWRRDVDTEPIGELVDTSAANAAISAARRRQEQASGPFRGIAYAVLVSLPLWVIAVLKKTVLAMSRGSAAFNDCGPAVAAELRRQAAALGGWREDDVVRAHALRDLFLRRADELDPRGGES